MSARDVKPTHLSENELTAESEKSKPPVKIKGSLREVAPRKGQRNVMARNAPVSAALRFDVTR